MIMCPAVVAEQNRVHLECNLGWQKPQAEKIKCKIGAFWSSTDKGMWSGMDCS